MAGTYNPHANKYGEKLITLNFDRIKHWLVVGAQPTVRPEHAVRARTRMDAAPRHGSAECDSVMSWGCGKSPCCVLA
jgi:ribosomal protein S16